MRSTKSGFIKLTLLFSAFSSVTLAQSSKIIHGDETPYSAINSAGLLPTFLHKFQWFLKDLGYIAEDGTEIYQNITSQECVSHIGYIIDQLSQAVSNNGNPVQLNDFVMQSKWKAAVRSEKEM